MNSNDVTQSYAKILEIGDIDIVDLLPAQNYQLKQLCATELALSMKTLVYQT